MSLRALRARSREASRRPLAVGIVWDLAYRPHPLKNRIAKLPPGLSSTQTVLSCGTLARGAKGTVDVAHRPARNRSKVKGPSPHHKEEERGHPEAACVQEQKRTKGQMLCNVKKG